MESTVYLVDDLASIMRGILIAHENSFAWRTSDQARAFDAGFVAAMHAVSTAIHVSLDFPANDPPELLFGQSMDAESECYVVQLHRRNDSPATDLLGSMRSSLPIHYPPLLE